MGKDVPCHESKNSILAVARNGKYVNILYIDSMYWNLKMIRGMFLLKLNV